MEYLDKVKVTCHAVTTKDEYPDEKFDAIVVFNKADERLRHTYRETPIILIDHGASNLKWFLGSFERYLSCDYFLTAGPHHKESMESFFGPDNNIKASAFIKSNLLFSSPSMTRKSFCARYNLDENKNIVLFAPTWFTEFNDDTRLVLDEIEKCDNHIVCQHVEKAQLDGETKLNIVSNDNNIIVEIMKHADIVISDTSSILYEAAALGKHIIQVLLKSYPDNPSKDYEYPVSAGSARFFVCGLPARPSQIGWAIKNVSNYSDALSYSQKKILKGTVIARDSYRRITEQLITCINEFGSTSQKNRNEHDRSKYQKNLMRVGAANVIAHAGGIVDGDGYTNSKESIIKSCRSNALIELDIVSCSDGLVVAHDETEEKYGLSQKFSDVTTDTFLQSRFNGKYTPMSFRQLCAFICDKDVYIVLDIKDVGDKYCKGVDDIHAVAAEYNVQGRLIPQVYCYEDFEHVIKYDFYGSMVSLWKYFDKDPFSAKSLENLERIFDADPYHPIGISLRYKNCVTGNVNTKNSDIYKLLSFGVKIFIHGQDRLIEEELLRNNFGLFSHHSLCETRDLIPSDFKWKEYLYLNRDLIKAGITEEHDVKLHWLNHGHKENRKYRFDIPNDFDWKMYLRINSCLQQSGLSEEYELKAHWTKFPGQLRYK
ncbi:MAG: CDP-glycerol glycerophosphotransferase family protein [Gammaproteobacteria bacterium]|nr:CDP-glycerol glycerophosphotransferase family protein [Gammaproteobacteria bacterium]